MNTRDILTRSLLLGSALCLLIATGSHAFPTRDFNGDGVLDALDLFEASVLWQETVNPDTLLQTSDYWHSDPPPTPTPVGSPTPAATPTPESTVTPAVTPTSTPAGTPTATPLPGSPRVLLSACKTDGLVDDYLHFSVHLLDGHGRIANPGIAGNVAPVTVTLDITGGAAFYGVELTWPVIVYDARGGFMQVMGTSGGPATVTATAPGYAAAEPLQLSITEGGRIAGAVEIFDASLSEFRPATFMDLIVNIYETGTRQYAGYANIEYETPGVYESSPLPTGAYDLVFEPHFHDSDLEAFCVPGVVVQAGQTTQDVNASLGPAAGGHRVFGTITASDSADLQDIMVTLTPVDGGDCTKMAYQGFEYFDEPQAVAPYEIANVRDGEYLLNVHTFAGENNYTTLGSVRMTVSGGDVETNQTVYPYYHLAAVRPGDFQRVPAAYTFEWEAPAGGQNWVYELQVLNSCGGTLWRTEGITGTTVEYGGPPLDRTQLYSWHVIGVADDASGSLEPWSGVSSDFVVE